MIIEGVEIKDFSIIFSLNLSLSHKQQELLKRFWFVKMLCDVFLGITDYIFVFLG